MSLTWHYLSIVKPENIWIVQLSDISQVYLQILKRKFGLCNHQALSGLQSIVIVYLNYAFFYYWILPIFLEVKANLVWQKK